MPQISIARYRPFQWQDILSPRSNEQYQGRCWDFPLTSLRYDPRGPVLRISADCVHPNQREGLAYSTIYTMSIHMSTLFCSDSGVQAMESCSLAGSCTPILRIIRSA